MQEAAGSCAAGGCSRAGTLSCGGCHGVRYCSRECQVLEWKQGHRKVCSAFPSREALRSGADDRRAADAFLGMVASGRAYHWQQIIGGLKVRMGHDGLNEILMLHGCLALRCAQKLAAGFPFEAVWAADEIDAAEAAKGGITPLAHHAAGLLQEAVLMFHEYYRSGLDPVRFKGAKGMAPIFVFGLPRSGTTAVQRLLALDEGQLRTLRRFEAAVPSTVLHGSDAARVEAYLENLDHEVKATSRDFHSTKPFDVAETSDFFASGLTSTAAIVASDGSPGAEAWRRYLDKRDDLLLLEYLRLFLELSSWRDVVAGLAAQREDGAGAEAKNAKNAKNAKDAKNAKRWVLKDPLHVNQLDAILRVFPNAKFVFCHRDLRSVLKSTLGMQMARVDNGVITNDEAMQRLRASVDTFPGVLAKSVAFRAKVRAKAPLHFADVFIDDVNEDPAAAVAKLYADLGLKAPEGHAEAVRAFAKENPAPPPRQLRTIITTIEDADGMNDQFSHYVDAFPRMKLKPRNPFQFC